MSGIQAWRDSFQGLKDWDVIGLKVPYGSRQGADQIGRLSLGDHSFGTNYIVAGNSTDLLSVSWYVLTSL